MLDKIFTSKTKSELLSIFFNNSHKRFYIREIERLTGINAGNIKREIDNLLKSGIIVQAAEGRIRYYAANREFYLFEEFKKIFEKTTGFIALLKKIFAGQKGVRLAFIYGSYAKGSQTHKSDIDLIIIGGVNLKNINLEIRKLEKKLEREINYTVYSEDEFKRKIAEGDEFLRDVLNEPKIMLAGGEKWIYGATKKKD